MESEILLCHKCGAVCNAVPNELMEELDFKEYSCPICGEHFLRPLGGKECLELEIK